MSKKTIKIKLDACCLNCIKSGLIGTLEEKLRCEVNGEEVEDEHSCCEWECDFNLFEICGFGIEGVEMPTLPKC